MNRQITEIRWHGRGGQGAKTAALLLACLLAAEGLEQALERWEACRPALEELAAYYDGGDWLSDFTADEAGLLPEDLKRGVLSEDGLYDLLLEADLAAEGVGKRFRG